MFDEFQIDHDPNEYLHTPPVIAPLVTLRGATPAVDHLRDFKCGIRHNLTLFPILKDTKQWDAWYIETKVQARAQDVEKILNPQYKPVSDDSKVMHE